LIPNQNVKVKWVGYVKKYYISLGYSFTKLLDEFEVNIKDLPLKSNMYVLFVCDYCNGEKQIEAEEKYAKYSNLMNHRKNIEKDCCRNCKGKKLKEVKRNELVPLEETLVIKTPEIASEWNYDRNEKTPLDYRYTHNYTDIWWKCAEGHEWQETIYNRSYRSFKCPYCIGRFVNKENSLAAKYPHLIKEWHPTKNGDLTPDDVSPITARTAWWVGKCGHEWETQVRHRAILETKCPYCTGHKVSISNCLMTINPKLALDWHPTKNNEKTAYDFTSSSSEKVWWLCGNCNYDWLAAIGSRNGGNNCPLCNETKGEREVRRSLESNTVKFRIQHAFEDLKGVNDGYLRFDFAVANEQGDLLFLLEYDGEFHFYKIFENEGHENTVIHDILKDLYCIENNIALIRIPYWEYESLEDIVTAVIAFLGLNSDINLNESIDVTKYLVNNVSWTREGYKKEFLEKTNNGKVKNKL
jgi:hypothetical protein